MKKFINSTSDSQLKKKEILNILHIWLKKGLFISKSLRNTKIKIRLIVSFLVLSIIPLTLIGIHSYSLLSSSIDSKIRTYSKQLIKENGIQIENMLEKYKNNAIEMSISDDIQKKIELVLTAEGYDNLQAYEDLTNFMLVKFSTQKAVSFASLILENGQSINYNNVNDMNDTQITGRLKKLADNNENQDVVWTTEDLDSVHTLLCIRKIKGVSWSKDLGYLIIGINNDEFLNLYKDVDIGKSSELFVLDSSNKVISSSNKDMLGTKYKDKGLMREITKDENRDIFDYNNNVFSYKKIQGTDWYLVGRIPMEYIQAEPNRIRISLVIFIAICVVLSVLLSYIISESISKPLNKIVHLIKEAKNGNLSFNIRDNHKDEIAVVIESFNEMAANIRMLIEQVRFLAVNDVLKSSELIAKSSRQSHFSAEQISKAILDVAEGASNQAGEINDTVLNMNSLVESFNEVENNMKCVFEMVYNTKELSHYSLDTVKLLNDRTFETGTAYKEVVEDIVGLNEYMRQIRKITRAIVEISNQTKLLALNASIEAARAGESGKGFAVVAGEVRKLAHQSKEASISINTIINNIQQKTEHAVQIAFKANNILDAQTGAVKDTDNSFRKIYDAMSSISQFAENVSASLKKAILSKDSAVHSMKVISMLATGAAASAEEVASSTEKQILGAEELTHLSEQLNAMAHKLGKAVDRFKLE